MIDGFAGAQCDFEIDVLEGFDVPEFDITVSPPGQLCPDVLNPGEFAPVIGSGAVVTVQSGGIATTDLTFFWLDPNGNLIATTQGAAVGPNIVQGSLDGSFFNEPGIYSCLLYTSPSPRDRG